MRIRWALALGCAATLGAAVAVLPTVASSETQPAIEAYSSYSYGTYRSWKPETLTVGEGATVTVSNPSTEVHHGVEWKSGPETPVCTSGVPVAPEAGKTSWTGTCTFAKPGTYVFWCSVHHQEMTETVTVQAGATTGTTGTTPGGTTGTTPGGAGGGGTTSPSSSSLTLPASAVKVRSTQHGQAVHGSVNVPSAAVGGRLEVVLLARRAAIATGHSSLTRVGRITRSHLAAGTVAFKVPLGASARRALARAHRLALTVNVKLTSPAGALAGVQRKVSLRA